MRAGAAQDEMVSPVLFSLHVNDVLTPPHHVELALDANTTATAMSRKLVLFVSCLETPQRPRRVTKRMEDSHQRFVENRDALKARRHIHKPRSVQLSGDPIYWADTARYLAVTLDMRQTWSHHIDQI
jgi:hypothetical protein